MLNDVVFCLKHEGYWFLMESLSAWFIALSVSSLSWPFCL